MKANHEELKRNAFEFFNQKNYDSCKNILIDLWSNTFGDDYKAIKTEGNNSSIYSQIEKINTIANELPIDKKNTILEIVMLLSQVSFMIEPLGKHYEKAFEWLNLAKLIAKSYSSETTQTFWIRYLELINYTGRKIHIMEIPISSHTDYLKMTYCKYLCSTNQAGIKVGRRLMDTVGTEDPSIQLMRYRLLCDLYADSPSQQNNYQIKDFAKKVFQFSNLIKEDEKRNNLKYFWLLKSVNYSIETEGQKEFYTLPDEETYTTFENEMIKAIYEFIFIERKTFKALEYCTVLTNFASRKGDFRRVNHYILWFIAMAEYFEHTEALDVYYIIYKSIMEILFSVFKPNERVANVRLENRFDRVNKVFFNDKSIQHWEKIDIILRKRVLPISPLAKVMLRFTENYFDMVYDEFKNIIKK